MTNFDYVKEPEDNDAFSLSDEHVNIANGKSFYNLPLHCEGSKTLLLAGSRPMLLMYNSQVLSPKHVKFGEWALKISSDGCEGKWLHDFDDITANYYPGRVIYAAGDSTYANLSVNLEFLPARNAEGVIINLGIQSSGKAEKSYKKIKIIWVWGGMAAYSGTYCPWDPGQKGRIYPFEKTSRSNVKISKDRFYMSMMAVPGIFVSGKTDWEGKYGIPENQDGSGYSEILFHESEAAFTDDFFSGTLSITWGEKNYVYEKNNIITAEPAGERAKSLNYSNKIAGSIRIKTPDIMLNSGLPYINYSADACWRPPSFLHSSSTWTDWYTGWRQLYGPILCGWEERAKSALKFISMHTSAPGKFPRNDSMSRLENAYIDPGKKATGRIHMSINPITGEAGGHHDCDHLFVDFAFHYLRWTGDTKLISDIWDALVDALNFQKTTRDPDEDGLYVNLLNNWMSDSHEYHQGACTIQSAYLYRNNAAMAEMAVAIGKDGKKFAEEAKKIKTAMFEKLWLDNKGIFAEYIDAAGIIHPVPEAPSIYFPIEFGLTDEFQSSGMLKFLRDNFRFKNGLLFPSPYTPSICYQAPIVSETLNMSLAAFIAGQHEFGWKMLSACFRTYDTGILHNNTYAPFNPQAGCSDGSIDMLDTASLFHRAVVEGLFGILPQTHKKHLAIMPGFPPDWKHASIETKRYGYSFNKTGDKIQIKLKADASFVKEVKLLLYREIISEVKINNRQIDFKCISGGSRDYLFFTACPGKNVDDIEIKYQLKKSSKAPMENKHDIVYNEVKAGSGIKSADILNLGAKREAKWHIYDDIDRKPCSPGSCGRPMHAPFAEKEYPGTLHERSSQDASGGYLNRQSMVEGDFLKRSIYLPVDRYCNGSIQDIFKSIPPEMVYGLRIHKSMPKVDTSHFDNLIQDGLLHSDSGIKFMLAPKSRDLAYITSKHGEKLFSQGYLLRYAEKFYAREYSDSMKISVGRRNLEHVYILFLGCTSIMQAYVPAVEFLLVYKEGGNKKIIFSNPCSFDCFLEHTSSHSRQILTQSKEEWLPSSFSNNVRQQHMDIAKIKVDPKKTLECIKISVVALDTTFALAGITLLKSDGNK